MVAVLDPAAVAGIKSGYFAMSAQDGKPYLVTPAGAIPVDAPRVLTALDDAQLSRMGSDYFHGFGGRVGLVPPIDPAAVGDNAFEGLISGHFFGEAARVYLANGAGSSPVVASQFDFVSSEVLDPRISFSRASSATRVNSQGLIEAVPIDQPRFDYDPVTLESRGLLGEEQWTNQHTYSEFQNGLTDAPTRAGLLTATDFELGATTTGLAIGYDGSTGSYAYKTNYAAPASTIHTFSVFVRMDDGGAPAFGAAALGSALNDFGIRMGAGVPPPNTYLVENFGRGLYRVSATADVGTTNLQLFGVIKSSVNSARSLKITGYQSVVGDLAASYIPTVGSAVTRAADTAQMAGTNFSDWFNSKEGTFVVEFEAAAIGQRLLSANDGTLSNRLLIAYTAGETALRAYVTVDGVNQAVPEVAVADARGVNKLAFAYKDNDFALCANGGTPSVANSGSLPTVDRLDIGRETNIYSNGHIRSVAYYPKRLANAQLQALTS